MEASNPIHDDHVTIHAWIKMGSEQRVTCIRIPARKYLDSVDHGADLEVWLEEFVFDWLYSQYGWGWSGVGYVNDYSCMEGNRYGGLGGHTVTAESSIPNTRAMTTLTGRPCNESDRLGPNG
jgi:hypothetical protein